MATIFEKILEEQHREVPRVHSILTTDKELLGKWFYLMALGRALDDRAPNYLKQAIGWSYHAPYAGHDGIQLAIGQVFDRSVDHLYPYYRDMLTTLSFFSSSGCHNTNKFSVFINDKIRLVRITFIRNYTVSIVNVSPITQFLLRLYGNCYC